MFKGEIIPILYNLFQKIEAANITLIQKSEKAITRKKNHKLISLMNIDVKIFNRTLASRTQQCIKTIHHDQVGFIPVMQA